ncbi:hypothetical protein V4F39_18425 [Aquincola sp. MAHUQ-54]|uniref:Uncharacterized protein n=1 Tax=Aquincola agrisoli TaxID=3119538 RepID=A0AAW9QK58_9BURK
MTRDGAAVDASASAAPHRLVYAAIRGGRSFAFPCDAAGTVELNLLSDRERCNYLLARALVGRDFHPPAVEPAPSSLEA